MKAKPKKKSEDKPPSSHQVGNKPSMEDLVKRAESGDDKALFELVKTETFIHPSSPIPPELKKLVPDHDDIKFTHVLRNAEDTIALQVGNKPTMKKLVASAKSGDDKSFLALVKIHTSVCLVDKVDYKLIIPSISAERDFYEQPWVQKRLREKMEDSWFEKDFWRAVSSRQNDTLFQRTTVAQAELKKYVVNRRDNWNEGLSQKSITFEDIRSELIQHGYIDEGDYQELKSLTRLLNNFGVTGKPGRTKKAK